MGRHETSSLLTHPVSANNSWLSLARDSTAKLSVPKNIILSFWSFFLVSLLVTVEWCNVKDLTVDLTFTSSDWRLWCGITELGRKYFNFKITLIPIVGRLLLGHFKCLGPTSLTFILLRNLQRSWCRAVSARYQWTVQFKNRWWLVSTAGSDCSCQQLTQSSAHCNNVMANWFCALSSERNSPTHYKETVIRA